VKGSAREKLKIMAEAAGMRPDQLNEALVHREWDRVSNGWRVVAPLAPVPGLPACLEFGPGYYATVRELRAALGALLVGRALTRALYGQRCSRRTVRRGAETHAGWAGVRVRPAGAGVAPPARPGGQDGGEVAAVAADAPGGQLGGLGTDEVVA
jgi:hypothetical protein